MKPPFAPEQMSFFSSRRGTALAGCVIAAATLAAYHGTFSVPFLLDDVPGIQNNPSIRHLWSLWRMLSPPPDLTTSGRPLVNLSLALDYARSGLAVRGYHETNLAIHIFAGLALFGLVRRTLLRRGAAKNPASAARLGFFIALIWALHPLQTAAVTYLIQRAETLMSLLYLLTLYCFIRGAEGCGAGNQRAEVGGQPASSLRRLSFRLWLPASVFCCLLGMAAKEVMVSAPLIVLLFDRTFVAGSFGQALRQRWAYYLGLAGTWILLAILVFSVGGNRNGSVGFGLGLNWWNYELTQFQAVAHYLWLSLWPHPLVFDYGPFSIRNIAEILPQAVVLLLLAVATVIGLRRRTALGFAGAWFFAILAPTSLMPGPTDMLDEHRMYLALTSVVACLVIGLDRLLGWTPVPSALRRGRGAGGLFLLLVLTAALGFLTARRNHDYRSELAIWTDTVTKRPENPAAHDSLGNALEHAGRLDEAVAEHERALQLMDFAQAHYNLGNVLTKLGRFAEAIDHYGQAIRLRPKQADFYDGLGNALYENGRAEDAIACYEEALQINPEDVHAQYGLGMALMKTNRMEEAIAHDEAALRLEPENALLHYQLAAALARSGRLSEAIEHYRRTLQLEPGNVAAQVNLGIALAESGRREEAVAHYHEALRLDPNSAEAHLNLGNVWFSQGRLEDAVNECREALRIKPDYADAHYNLGIALIQLGRLPEATEQFRELVRLNPADLQARRILARLESSPPAPGPLK
ncbi:MAG TPA: tetratricopeptide repeat protein [Opitutaceae bacterium]|nr:tetratricopeptide repeat protein [Opitutaceae bacterium]